MTVHAMKRDIFSAKTLMAIYEGVQNLADARTRHVHPITITNFHKTLFERLLQSFNNPTLLKEVGVLYLNEFGMPGIALKHFDLAHQFGPKDRDIEELQKAAKVAMARESVDQPGHSGLTEAKPGKVEVENVMRKTVRINVVEARNHLGESAGELGRKQAAWRKSGSLKKQTQKLMADFNKSLKQAERLTNQTDFSNAFAALSEAQKAGAPKEELLAHYAQLGLAAFDHDRMDEALEAFLLTRDLAPESVEGWFNCGLVYQRTGQLDDALACYNGAIRIAPDNPKTWCNLSSVYMEQGNLVEAETAVRQSLALRSNYPRAWDSLASVLSALNRLPEASDACQQAIRLQPALHSAWFKFGVINFQLDQLVKAQEAFNLTGDNPDFFPYVLYYLCMIEARRGELDLALQKLAEARNADPANELQSTALKELAAACTKIGRFTTAADFYRQVTELVPEDFSAWLSLGTAYHRADQFEKAREAYCQATVLQPENTVTWHNLGLLASDEGKHEEARDYFQREVELDPENAKAWYDLGISLQTLGLENESAEAFERAEDLVKSLARKSSDLSAALSIVRRLNLGERVLKTE
jgi:tetratricopeptide (TPR) repeat protein